MKMRFQFILTAFPLLVVGFCLAGCASAGLKGYQGRPFQDSTHRGGPQKIPGRVQCACYDFGGEGVAYHNTDSVNHGSGELNPANGSYLNEFRMKEGISTSYTKFHDEIDNNPYNLVVPPAEQLYVGWTVPGEWFNMTVAVEHTGVYTFDLYIPRTAAERFPWIGMANRSFPPSASYPPAPTRILLPGGNGIIGTS